MLEESDIFGPESAAHVLPVRVLKEKPEMGHNALGYSQIAGMYKAKR